MWIGIIGTSLLTFGCLLLLLWRRGSVVDSIPYCRACGFDLSGSPAASTACAECGRSTVAIKSVRFGTRHRSLSLLVIAVLVSCTGMSMLVTRLPFFQSEAWRRNKPLLLLEWDLRSADQSHASANEIIRRFAGLEISNSGMRRIARELLDVQSDTTAIWASGYGDIIETAAVSGTLSADEIRRYITQAIRVEMHLAERMNTQTGAIHDVLVAVLRGSDAGLIQVSAHVRDLSMDDEDLQQVLMRSLPTDGKFVEVALQTSQAKRGYGMPPIAGLRPGVKTGRATVHIYAQDALRRPLFTEPLVYPQELVTRIE
jgi:predicted RNA-binding Zn-ribbon protein involved in translation (DUF1610 family)